MVTGGNRLTYAADTGSPAASLLETKILLNSTISDAHKCARFMSMDLKDFFLATPMEKPEFMKVPKRYFPNDIQDKYNLHEKIHNDYVYIKIKMGMYGLKQAAILAYENLVKNLSKFGYEPIEQTDSFWRHKNRPTKFCLFIDDFGVKYFDKADINHLISSLQHNYKLSTDFSGYNYYELTINWNYANQFVDISMPGYIEKALTKFQHTPKIPQYSPHQYTRHQYGKTAQYTPGPDTSPATTKKETKHVQSVTCTFLY